MKKEMYVVSWEDVGEDYNESGVVSVYSSYKRAKTQLDNCIELEENDIKKTYGENSYRKEENKYNTLLKMNSDDYITYSIERKILNERI